MGVWAGSPACHFRELSGDPLTDNVPGGSKRPNWRSLRGTRDFPQAQPIMRPHVGRPNPDNRSLQIGRRTARNSGAYRTESGRDPAG
jgi:hypothetical protein